MKRLLIAAGLIGLISGTQVMAQETVPAESPKCPCQMKEFVRPNIDNCAPKRMHKRPDFKRFEQELKLTDEQKAKAREIRENEQEQIKPIFDKIGEKYREQKEIMDKKLTADERQQELAPIRKELRELRGEIHKIKKQSREAFEAILTSKQAKQLAKLKEDARKDFEKRFPNRRIHCGWHKVHPTPMPIEPDFGRCICPKPIIHHPEIQTFAPEEVSNFPSILLKS